MVKEKIARWFEVDNSAFIYPITASKGEQNLFKLSAELTEEVDPELLSLALSDIMPRFPSFNVKLGRSFFSYIFEENFEKPLVFTESDVIMRMIDFKENNGFLFRTTYFRHIISLEFFHVLTDGAGGLEFLKGLLLRYLQLKGYPVNGENIIPEYNSPPLAEESEDSFSAYYRRYKIKDLNLKSVTGSQGQSFILNGMPFDTEGTGIINFQTDVREILRQAKQYGATLTAYLTGLLMYSIYRVKVMGMPQKKLIQIFMPINLRKIFPSVTLRNFTFMTKVSAKIVEKQELKDFVDIASEALKSGVSKDKLQRSISAVCQAEKNFFIRIAPLALKYVVIKAITAIMVSRSGQTATLTSPGIIPMPESLKPYVAHINMFLFPGRSTRLTVSALTYNNELSCTFCRRFMDTEVEKFFIRYLSVNGAEVRVSGNFRELATKNTAGMEPV